MSCQWKSCRWMSWERRTVARLFYYIVVLRGGSASDCGGGLTGVSQRRRATLTVRVIVFGGGGSDSGNLIFIHTVLSRGIHILPHLRVICVLCNHTPSITKYNTNYNYNYNTNTTTITLQLTLTLQHNTQCETPPVRGACTSSRF